MNNNTDLDDRPNRRRFLAALSAAGIGGLAGCGFGGDGDQTTIQPITTLPPEKTPIETPTTTASTTQPPTEDRTTSTQTTTTAGMVEGRVWRLHVPPPLPADVHYNPVSPSNLFNFWFDGQEMMRLDLYSRSLLDLEMVPEAARDWSYVDGVLTVELFEDHYWVSDAEDERKPTNVVADDWVEANWMLLNRHRSSTFEAIEKLGEHRFRVFFSDIFNTDHALHLVEDDGLTRGFNSAFWRPFIDQYQDATSDDERDSVTTDAANKPIPTPDPVTNVPFRVSETAEDRWRLRLRNDESATPRWVTNANFAKAEIVVREKITEQTQAFRNGKLPFAGTMPAEGGGDASLRAFDQAAIDPEVPFQKGTLTLPRNIAQAEYAMQMDTAPTERIHFRRALAYLLNRASHRTRLMEGDRIPTGFKRDADEQRFLSNSMLSTLEDAPHQNYGYDAVLTDIARAEMEAGGFERDSGGNWLYQSGDRSGEPISIEVIAPPGMDRVVAKAESFLGTAEAFGVDLSITTLSGSEWSRRIVGGEFTIALGYWLGRMPSTVYAAAFPDISELVTHGPIESNVGFPGNWTGPPVGEFASPPSVASEATATFDIASLVNSLHRLPDGQRQENIDRLAWVYNQSMARLPIGHLPWIWTVNTDAWNWPLPTEENPNAWTSIPRRKLWQRGFVDAVAQPSA